MKPFRLLLLIMLITGCQTGPDILSPDTHFAIEVPPGFPAISFPEDNAFTLERWELGKRLFFDSRLSRTETISCASCHKPELAFSDMLALSPGVENRPGNRNAPTLANIAYHPYFTREGGVPTLEMQVLVPIQEHHEFDFNIIEIARRLSSDSTYQLMSLEAYDRPLDYYVITRALANFERSLISGHSTYDLQLQGKKPAAWGEEEALGKELFFSERTQCSACHNGFNFTNYAFENNGLYLHYVDPGRFRLTGDTSDLARFKVPTLRNIGLTAPYMHDGSLATLRDVIDHYNAGGSAHIHKSDKIRPLHLTEFEITCLEAFLHSLTDFDFITHPDFKSP